MSGRWGYTEGVAMTHPQPPSWRFWHRTDKTKIKYITPGGGVRTQRESQTSPWWLTFYFPTQPLPHEHRIQAEPLGTSQCSLTMRGLRLRESTAPARPPRPLATVSPTCPVHGQHLARPFQLKPWESCCCYHCRVYTTPDHTCPHLGGTNEASGRGSKCNKIVLKKKKKRRKTFHSRLREGACKSFTPGS